MTDIYGSNLKQPSTLRKLLKKTLLLTFWHIFMDIQKLPLEVQKGMWKYHLVQYNLYRNVLKSVNQKIHVNMYPRVPEIYFKNNLE